MFYYSFFYWIFFKLVFVDHYSPTKTIIYSNRHESNVLLKFSFSIPDMIVLQLTIEKQSKC